MVKKNKTYDYDDEDVVIDKKTKRRMERARSREVQQSQSKVTMPVEGEVSSVEESHVDDSASDDRMSRIVMFCQDNRWREALVLGRSLMSEMESSGNEDMALGLSAVVANIEFSMRRQKAAMFLSKSREMLKKEYLLDVGE